METPITKRVIITEDGRVIIKNHATTLEIKNGQVDMPAIYSQQDGDAWKTIDIDINRIQDTLAGIHRQTKTIGKDMDNMIFGINKKNSNIRISLIVSFVVLALLALINILI